MTTTKHKPSLPVTIREATLRDLPYTTTISLAAFANDDVNLLIYPPMEDIDSNQYHSLLQSDMIRRHRLRLLSPDKTYLVALAPDVSGDADKSGEKSNVKPKLKIVGTACWYRRRPETSSQPQPHHTDNYYSPTFPRNTFLQRLELALTNLTDRLSSFISPPFPNITNESGLKAYLDSLDHADSILYATPTLQNRWELESITVDPSYQGLGIGGKLVDWGCEKADEEGLCCSLEASPVGMKLYSKKGFVTMREETVVCPKTGKKAEVTFMMREARPKGKKSSSSSSQSVSE